MEILRDALALIGVTLLVGSAALISLPLAGAVLGLILVIAAVTGMILSR